MPKIDRAICKNSVRPWMTRNSVKESSVTTLRILIGSFSKKPGEVNGYAHTLARVNAPNVLIDRKLHAAGDGVVLVDAERCRADENLIAPTARDTASRTFQEPRSLPGAFAKDAPVPAVILAPGLGPIGVCQAVEQQVGPP